MYTVREPIGLCVKIIPYVALALVVSCANNHLIYL